MYRSDSSLVAERRPERALLQMRGALVGMLAVLGAGLNWFPIPLGYGLDLLPGVIAGYVALLLVGRWAAACVAALAALPTLLLWGHPWAAILMVAEVLFVGWFLRRWPTNLPLAVLVYWLLPGALLLLVLSQLFIGFDPLSFILVLIKQTFSGILSAALAGLLVLLLATWVSPQNEAMSRVVSSYRSVLLNALVVLVVLPLMAFVAIDTERQRDAIEAEIHDHLGHGLDMLDAEMREIRIRKQYRLAALADYIRQLNDEDPYTAVMERTVQGALLSTETFSVQGMVELGKRQRPEAIRLFTNGSMDSDTSQLLQEALPGLLEKMPEDGPSELFRISDKVMIMHRVRLEENAAASVLLFSMLPLPRLQERLSFTPFRRNLGVFLGRGADRWLAGNTLRCADQVSGEGCDVPSALDCWPGLTLQLPQQRPAPSKMHQWSGARLWSTRSLPDSSDIMVTVGYDPRLAIQEYRARLLGRLTLFAGIAMLAFLVTYRLSRAVSVTLERNARAIERLPDNLQMPRYPSRLREVDALNRALQNMARSLDRERRRALEHAQRLERMVQNAPVVIWGGMQRAPEVFQFSFMSDSLHPLTGHESVQDHDAWMALVHPSDRAEAVRFSRELFEHGYSSCEYRLRKADGRYIWIYAENAVIDDHEDGVREVVGLWLDISALKLRQAQLTQSAKLATLGEMASGIAHELNQPLQVIQLAAENALDALASGARCVGDPADLEYAQVRLRRILKQSERAARIVDHMRLFGRRGEEPDAVVALDSVVRDALSLLGQQLRAHGIDVRLEVLKTPPEVSAQRQLLEQVVVNLLLNARDAIDRRRNRLSVESRSGFMGVIRVQIDLAKRNGEHWAQLTMSDNGGGIAEDQMEHVFEPFFTTKELGEGPGLGLSISYGIIRDMGGFITCRNQDEGACFTIELPAAADRAGDDDSRQG